MGRISSLLNDVDQYSTIIKSEIGGSKILWEAKMLYCFLRYGAKPVDYWRFQFWRKSASECDKYLTSMRYSRIYKELKKRTDGGPISSKTREYNRFKDFIKREWVAIDSHTPDDEVLAFIAKHQIVIAKPNNGEQGHGVMKIKVEDQKKINELLDFKKNNVFVLEECLKNIEDLDRMNPTSLNTIRCYTMIDKEGKDRIMEIILRAGAPGSHVDNWGSGGVAYYFDVETGICKGPGVDKKNKTHMLHPGSQFQVVGYKLPDYEKLLDYIHQLMNVDRTARFVGWDIALTPNGYDLVEMNCPGGHDLLQGFGKPWGSFFKENW